MNGAQVTLFLFPVSFFYYFMFYTDTCSTLSLVLLQILSCTDQPAQGPVLRSNLLKQVVFTLVRRLWAAMHCTLDRSFIVLCCVVLNLQVACGAILCRQTN